MVRGQKRDWAAEADALANDDFLSNVPMYVLMAEAVDVVAFCKKYWKATEKLPGLEQAGPSFPEAIADEMMDLLQEVQVAKAAYLATVPKTNSAEVGGRARFVLSEITATLEWLFDDGVEDANDERLAAVVKAHRDDGESNDELASELEDYAALARPNQKAMKGLGGFDVALIEEAFELAGRLRALPPVPTVLSAEARLALGKRNRLLTLLSQRMGRARSAARFVFRNHPEVIREATSAYDRRRRAEARRKAAQTPTTPATPSPSAPPA